MIPKSGDRFSDKIMPKRMKGRQPRQARSVRAAEEVRVVGSVGERIHQGEAIPRVALHVEDERLDFMLRRLHGKTGAAGAIQLHLHLLKIDHGGLPGWGESTPGTHGRGRS